MHNSLKSLLSSIEVGDSIWLVSYASQPIYRKVTKVSKTIITTNGGYRFKRKNGVGVTVDSPYEIGAGCSPDGYWSLFSDDDIEEMQQSRKKMYRGQIIIDIIEERVGGFNDRVDSNDVVISSIYAILFPYDRYLLVPLSEVANYLEVVANRLRETENGRI